MQQLGASLNEILKNGCWKRKSTKYYSKYITGNKDLLQDDSDDNRIIRNYIGNDNNDRFEWKKQKFSKFVLCCKYGVLLKSLLMT